MPQAALMRRMKPAPAAPPRAGFSAALRRPVIPLRGAPTGRTAEEKTQPDGCPACGPKGQKTNVPVLPQYRPHEFPIVCRFAACNVEIKAAKQAVLRRRNPQCGNISTKTAAKHAAFVEIHSAASRAALAANVARWLLHQINHDEAKKRA